MTFALERFDIVKQNYDKSGLYIYHDTVGKGNTDPNSKIAGNSLAEIAADNFFNPVAEELQVPGGIIIWSYFFILSTLDINTFLNPDFWNT